LCSRFDAPSAARTALGAQQTRRRIMMRYVRTLACCGALVALLALPTTAAAQRKTVKQCNDEWTANRATIAASGKLKKDFIAECRSGNTATRTAPPQPSPAARTAPPDQPAAGRTAPPEQSPAARTAKPEQPAAAPKRAPAPAPATAGVASGQYATEAAAKSRCPNDAVVWVNLSSKIYHFSNAKAYGKTKNGAYMCEGDTAQAGFRASKSEKRPGG